MDADPSILCDVPDGPNARMKRVAVLTIVVYVLGLPALLSTFLWKRREAVRVDQALRERGAGDSALTNPHIQVRLDERRVGPGNHMQHACNGVEASRQGCAA